MLQEKVLRIFVENYKAIDIGIKNLIAIAVIVSIAAVIYVVKNKKIILRKQAATIAIFCGGILGLSIFLNQNIIQIATFFHFSTQLFITLILYAGIATFIIFLCMQKLSILFRGSYAENVKNDKIVLGIKQGDFGEEAINPQFLSFNDKALFGDIHIIGGKGSGKTTTCVIPPIQQLLSDTRKNRPVIFLIDIKGNLTQMIKEMNHPRKDDVWAIGYGNEKGNLIDLKDPLITANNLSTAFSNAQEGTGSSFHKDYQETYLRKTLSFFSRFLKRDRNFDELDSRNEEHLHLIETEIFKKDVITLIDINRWFNDYQLKKDLIGYINNVSNNKEYFDQNIYEDVRYFEKTFQDKEDLLSGMISQMDTMLDEKIREYFNYPRNFDFEDAINKGKIICVNVPEGQFGSLSKIIGLTILLQFQRTCLSRMDTSKKMNRSRYIYIFLDEVQKFMCKELANFPSVSRAAKVSNIFLHQSLGQIPPEYRDDLFGNTLTKISLYVRDPETAEYMSRNFGQHIITKTTKGKSKMRGSQNSGLLSSGMNIGQSESETEQREYRFYPTDFTHLKRDKAIISMSDGSSIQESFTADLLPFYKKGNDLFPIHHFIVSFKRKLTKEEARSLKKALAKTAIDFNAQCESFQYSRQKAYFFYAFSKPKVAIDSIKKTIQDGINKLIEKNIASKLYTFQGDSETVQSKKEEENF